MVRKYLVQHDIVGTAEGAATVLEDLTDSINLHYKGPSEYYTGKQPRQRHVR